MNELAEIAGYVLTGIAALLLGVCVTLLSFRIRRSREKERDRL